MVKRKREGNVQAANFATTTNNSNTTTIPRINGHGNMETSPPADWAKRTSKDPTFQPPPDPVDTTTTTKAEAKTHSEPLAATNGITTSDGTTSNTPKAIHTIQIVTGSYESVLHGITATISTTDDAPVIFSETFLFNAHASSIRCLALSPLPESTSQMSGGVYLATGGSDERVNVYSLSASALPHDDHLPRLPTLSMAKLNENPANRELGNLIQHSAPITSLHFPSRSKLLSASEDNTISITRTRDLEVVSTIKAPRPKVQGQPSGDTAPQGVTSMGVNDFAVHPSMKLMVTVGKGERCMRLWNLVTGKKAGVLNFERKMLESIHESKYSSGEGRKICWNSSGSSFAVAFERGVLVFGEDSRVKAKITLFPTKVCQMKWIILSPGKEVLMVSTEDGRVVFFDTDAKQFAEVLDVQDAKVTGQLGGKDAHVKSRIKDFAILDLNERKGGTIVITASSDGSVQLWRLFQAELTQSAKLIGTYESGNRITCLAAFVMQAPTAEDEVRISDFEGLTSAAEDSSESDGSGSGDDDA